MSVDLEAAAAEVCASCGKAALDDVKLKKCACKLVKYCSVDCQKNHRSQHKKECKKGLAELRDNLLFTQPEESYLGECPICFLPLPLDLKKSSVFSCCCKAICKGCAYTDQLRDLKELPRELKELWKGSSCPFCRTPPSHTNEEIDQNYMKRAKVNDLIALCEMGKKCKEEGDYEGAFDYFSKAAALGEAGAHYNLSVMYDKGEGAEKDRKKEMHHLEEAAIGGHPYARYNLGVEEGRNGRYERATKHFIIAANLGYEGVKENFRRGFVSKDDYAAALRGHQAAVDATKSKQREEAYSFFKEYNRLSGMDW